MPRLIDADKLWKAITTRIEEYCDIADLIEIIETQPTVDAVEVVRCKDCRHSFMGNYFNGYACKRLSGEHTFTVSSDGFCSKGERRE